MIFVYYVMINLKIKIQENIVNIINLKSIILKKNFIIKITKITNKMVKEIKITEDVVNEEEEAEEGVEVEVVVKEEVEVEEVNE